MSVVNSMVIGRASHDGDPIPKEITFRYGREELLRIGNVKSTYIQRYEAPTEHVLSRKRKRGKKGGLRQRIRDRKTRPPLPTLLLSNVRSLRNQMSELSACVKYLYEYRDSCLLCFTETWLNDAIDSSTLNIDGFGSPIRLDRDPTTTGKSTGGGVCVYINKNWCKDYIVRDRVCNEDIELLSLSLRPFYLPREFGHIFLTLAYIHPKANYNKAADIIKEHVSSLENLSPDAPKLILGDFNGCAIKKELPHYYQYVTCPTRNVKTIDLCYGNIKDAYKSYAKPPLGTSDHNSIQLVPAYKQKIKSTKPVTKCVKSWTEDAVLELQGCFDCTNWDIFETTSTNLEEMTDVVTDYINFCVDNIVPDKTIKIFPNNKPWVTKELKSVLVQKKRAFCSGNKTKVKSIQRDIKRLTRKCKLEYKEKIEERFRASDTRQAWNGVRTMIGNTKTRQNISTNNDLSFANELNSFYARYDTTDFSYEQEAISNSLPHGDRIILSEREVTDIFSRLNVRKAAGPDKIQGRVLKQCCCQLSYIFLKLFQLSLDTHNIPSLWKSSAIIPIPKKPKPSILNDYRPVALTSIPMKCLERLVLKHLRENTKCIMDPLQFAYQAKRGVEDAVVSLLHRVYTHIESSGSYARILFVDFSSAFNTIQPHILMSKLKTYGVNSTLIHWIRSFLSNRSQHVRVNQVQSEMLTTNTGAPQGCVISPVLFTLYTNDCRSRVCQCFNIKFADDTAMVGLIRGSELEYRREIDSFAVWCSVNYLELNIKKTKELVIDFRPRKTAIVPVIINSQPVEIVSEYRYLGTVIDSKLSWNSNTTAIYNKGQQRLYFLRKLRSFNVDPKIMTLFYLGFIESIVTFSFHAWFGSLSVQNKNKLNSIIKISSKILGKQMPSLQILYDIRILKKARIILNDDMHVLNDQLQFLPSGRRLRVIPFKTNRAMKTFIPNCIRLINNSLK
jgi:hypothetical protein